MRKGGVFKKNKKKIFLFPVLLLILSLTIITIGGYLYIKYLFGRGTLIQIKAEKQNFFIEQGQPVEASFAATITPRIFCEVNCSLSFTDLSNQKIISSKEYTFNSQKSFENSFTIKPNRKGEGQDLYRFDIKCSNIKSTFCKNEEKPKIRSLLVTLNYNRTEDEKKKMENLEKKFSNLSKNKAQLYEISDLLNRTIEKTKNYIEDQKTEEEIKKNIRKIKEIDQKTEKLKELWNNEKFDEFEQNLPLIEEEIIDLTKKSKLLNKTLENKISKYNTYITILDEYKKKFENLNETKVTNETLFLFEEIYFEYNKTLYEILENKSINNLEKKVRHLISTFDRINQKIQEDSYLGEELNYTLIFTLPEIEVSPIKYPEIRDFEIEKLNDIKPKCCIFGKCEDCCDDSCRKNRKLYPIIFLHGHEFNQDASAELSLDTFDDFQIELEKEGYINGGTATIDEIPEQENGLLGKVRAPISFRASYYFDIYKTKGHKKIIQTKTDSIETYALRLKDIIEVIKSKTNREKVIIVAHSMGGLVVRRYLQIYGESDVEKVILIGTPNKGIRGDITKYCAVFGAELECKDMDSESLFINKLNNAKQTKLPIYNIIGIGCKMGEENGDGIVTQESAYLESAENYFVNGTCAEKNFKYLHSLMIDPKKYPEIYTYIKNILSK